MREEKRREELSFHSEEKSESAAVGSVAAIEKSFYDRRRSIRGKSRPVESGSAHFHCLPTQRSPFTFSVAHSNMNNTSEIYSHVQSLDMSTASSGALQENRAAF